MQKTPLEDIPDFVKGEIYIAINKINWKPYVGQTRTHIMNHGKYRPFGSHKRWIQHVSEAIGEYEHQSAKLNNAIRKYGGDGFDIHILEICELSELNFYEKLYIRLFDCVKSGYNLTYGGDKQFMTEEGKQKVANTLVKHYADIKTKKFENKDIVGISIGKIVCLDKTIVNLNIKINENGVIKTVITGFGGKKCTLEDSISRAKEFALTLTTKDKITINPSIKDILTI